MDSTKKMTTKLVSGAAGTAAWVTNVAMEWGQVWPHHYRCSSQFSPLLRGMDCYPGTWRPLLMFTKTGELTRGDQAPHLPVCQRLHFPFFARTSVG
ncbi:hypothetical protein Q5P01_021800 [Channa striata]|uniref:Uncharacterized protein n=1 Tax=Channa striata TaxID=64152 RepID=A0AA88LUW5_CHASR|nr:hypothetical protein Q5P01_021800 [Channa striata]